MATKEQIDAAFEVYKNAPTELGRDDMNLMLDQAALTYTKESLLSFDAFKAMFNELNSFKDAYAKLIPYLK